MKKFINFNFMDGESFVAILERTVAEMVESPIHLHVKTLYQQHIKDLEEWTEGDMDPDSKPVILEGTDLAKEILTAEFITKDTLYAGMRKDEVNFPPTVEYSELFRAIVNMTREKVSEGFIVNAGRWVKGLQPVQLGDRVKPSIMQKAKEVMN